MEVMERKKRSSSRSEQSSLQGARSSAFHSFRSLLAEQEQLHAPSFKPTSLLLKVKR